jgi:hypothetical protein
MLLLIGSRGDPVQLRQIFTKSCLGKLTRCPSKHSTKSKHYHKCKLLNRIQTFQGIIPPCKVGLDFVL